MKSRGWVVNASPLIALGRLARLDLLTELADEVLVPQGVLSEVGAKLEKDWIAREVAQHPGLTVVADLPHPESLNEWDLGLGERCVLAQVLARPELTAVLDDHRARQAARAHSVPVTGTLGILVRARRATLIPRMAPLVEAMRALGFYASDEVIREALKSVGETWEGE